MKTRKPFVSSAMTCVAFVVAGSLFLASSTYNANAGWIKDRGRDLQKGVNAVLSLPGKIFGAQDVKNIDKALKDIFNAVESAVRFAGRQLELPGKTLERSMHKKDPFDSINFLATNPIKQTDKHAFQAARDSEILAAGGSLAASFYGGPNGAAAYAAWMSYHVTGDMDAALKQGAIVGITAAVSQSISKIENPASRKAAEIAFKNAVDVASGKDPKTIGDQMIPSLVTTLGEYVPAEDLNFMERTATAAAIGGAAVAVSGGDRKAVEQGFLRAGAKVGVQELNDELANAKEKVKSKVMEALPKEQLKEFNSALKESEAAIAQSKLAKALNYVENAKTEAKTRIKSELSENPTIAKIKEAKQAYDQKTRAAEQKWKQASSAMEKKVLALENQIKNQKSALVNATKRKNQALTDQLSKKLATAEKDHAGLVQQLNTDFVAARNQYHATVAEAEKTIQTKAAIQFTEKVKRDGLKAVVLANGTVVSWDPEKLLSQSTTTAVFITYSEQVGNLPKTIAALAESTTPK